MTGRPASTESPLRAKALLAARGMSQATLLEQLNEAGLRMSASSLSRYLTHGRVQGFDVDQVRTVICALLKDDGACDAHHTKEIKQMLSQKETMTQKALEFFRLPVDPFLASAVQSADDVYVNSEFRFLSKTLYYAAKNANFVAVVGESGSGKSVLRKVFLDSVKREYKDIIVMQCANTEKDELTPQHIREAIVAAFNEAPRRSKEALARQVERLLRTSIAAKSRHLFVVEEAHDLTIRMLKQFKRFWEMESDFSQLMGVALIAQPELLKKIDPRNWDVREVSQRCQVFTLNPLPDAVSVRQFVSQKLKAVDITFGEIFDVRAEEAIKEWLTQEDGKKRVNLCYPLAIENLVVKAMNEAANFGEKRISFELIRGLR